MTVAELVAKLLELDQDAPVYVKCAGGSSSYYFDEWLDDPWVMPSIEFDKDEAPGYLLTGR